MSPGYLRTLRLGDSPPGGAPAVKACMEPPGDSANVCKMALEWKRYETIKRGIWKSHRKITIFPFFAPEFRVPVMVPTTKAHPVQFDKQIGPRWQ